MANKALVGKFVQFIGSPNMLYRVLDETKNSILVEDDIETYWERKEYIEYIYTEFAKKYVEYGIK